MTDTDGPTGRDQVVVSALIAGGSVRAAAREAGVSESTVTRVARRWRDHIRAERDERAEQQAAALLVVASKATTALIELLDSRNDAVRLGAVRTAYEHALRWRQATVTDVQVAELVQAMEAIKQQQRPWGVA